MAQKVQRQYNSQYGGARSNSDDYSLWNRAVKPNIAVYSIIAICVVVFIIELIDLNLTGIFWMWPDYPMPWMFVTSIFLHGGFEHLFWNMFMLFMFGVTLERMIGSYRFVWLFLAAGVLGNVGYVLFCYAMGITDPAIGASGAIYGVFACLALLAPNIRVYLFFFIPLRIVHALLFYAAIDIFFMNSNDSIAHAAHIAGLIAGLAFAQYFRKKLLEKQSYSISYQFDADL